MGRHPVLLRELRKQAASGMPLSFPDGDGGLVSLLWNLVGSSLIGTCLCASLGAKNLRAQILNLEVLEVGSACAQP